MASKEIQEADGASEKIEIEDSIAPVSEDEERYGRPVIICDCCAKGFLRWVPGGVDIDPIWLVISGTPLGGGICGGALRMVSRKRAFEIANAYEKVGGDAWLRGQRKP